MIIQVIVLAADHRCVLSEEIANAQIGEAPTLHEVGKQLLDAPVLLVRYPDYPENIAVEKLGVVGGTLEGTDASTDLVVYGDSLDSGNQVRQAVKARFLVITWAPNSAGITQSSIEVPDGLKDYSDYEARVATGLLATCGNLDNLTVTAQRVETRYVRGEVTGAVCEAEK